MPKVYLNRTQRAFLYNYLSTKEGGRKLWRLVERVYEALRIKSLEDADRENVKKPANEREVIHFDESQQPFNIDEADLEEIHKMTREWETNEGGTKTGGACESCRRPFMTTGAAWRTLLPLMDAIDAAMEKLKKRRENGVKGKGKAVEDEDETEVSA